MAWNTDRDPLTYLLRRIQYYKRKYNRLPNAWRKSPHLQARYTEQQVIDAMERTKKRIKQYERAVEVLRKANFKTEE